jgi:membrane associated rhomboid family serine protease
MKRMRFYALYLSVICVISFAIQKFVVGFTDIVVLNQSSWQEPWRFLTAVFAHASGSHLVYNLFALIFFGLIVEKIIGSKKFLILFIFSGIIVNLVSVNFYARSLGASGAIFGIIGCLTALRPRLIVWAFSLPMPMFIATMLWAAGDLLGIFIPIDNTANLAHLVGLALGLLIGVILRKGIKNKVYPEMNFKLSERHLRSWEDFYLKN